jgi:outer membrane receptor for ferric coprogen and ferric-rhodotorulic acid
MTTTKHLVKWAALILLAFTPRLVAQNAPSAVPPPAQPQVAEDVVILSPFEVNVDKDIGYQAQATLSGSRLNSRLKDTAAPISVFTEEFLQDLGVTSIADLATWAVGTEIDFNEDEPNENNMLWSPTNFRVRGLPASRARNYYGHFEQSLF